jgi:5-methyltetrahydrofolate--homocysteine methyltransferase
MGDDVILCTGESRPDELTRLHLLRQQWQRKGQECHRSLPDYIAPVGSGREDYLGGFVATSGAGANELAMKYKSELDDYKAIIVQAIGDRFAEALAEMIHEQARHDWSFGSHEDELMQNREDFVTHRGY